MPNRKTNTPVLTLWKKPLDWLEILWKIIRYWTKTSWKLLILKKGINNILSFRRVVQLNTKNKISFLIVKYFARKRNNQKLKILIRYSDSRNKWREKNNSNKKLIITFHNCQMNAKLRQCLNHAGWRVNFSLLPLLLCNSWSIPYTNLKKETEIIILLLVLKNNRKQNNIKQAGFQHLWNSTNNFHG